MNLRKKRKATGIPLSAMGDIAFLLLVFYMATTMVTDQKPREIQLPEVEADAMNSPHPLIIYLDHETAEQKAAYFYNQMVPLEELAEVVRLRAAEAPAAVRLYLNVEKDLPYRHMDAVIKVLKKAEIRQLIITTRSSEKNQK